ncbi:Site-specific recombinase XerD [Anaerosporobacter mobilis DSM 15930]|uniref:Site-specific recombinase XerD n=1 Tax=Anaerosporobacter mobilis DSM 15930 TaxID=1120996 RepID=A0A1M7IXT6_9FIRM|nr:tyrosine-type recombinase/integrase [Anaerosporobacter mobilis]MBS5933479.1 tyrosine-type recombinase/integrase [Clostridiales bacterium]SHM45522.1 Site-specific recombinase XerD [Anaerosporobacter mobilis DSM 15930]
MNKSVKRRDSNNRVMPTNISERADGRYCLRKMVNGKKILEYYNTLNEAKKRLKLLEAEIVQEKEYGNKKYKLEEWYKIFLNHYCTNLGQRTINNYTNYFARYMTVEFGKKRINNITQLDIVQYYGDLRNKCNLSRGTIGYFNSMLSRAFQKAVDNRIISSNPTLGVMREIKKEEPKKREALSLQQEINLLNYISTGRYYRYKALLLLLLNTGLRSGEARALTINDIDFNTGSIHINKSVSYDTIESNRKQHFVVPPKTKNSNRVVYVKKEVIDEIKNYIKMKNEWDVNRDYKICRYDEYKNRMEDCGDFLFTTSRGTVITDESLNKSLKAIIKECNINERKKAEEEKRDAILIPESTTIHCLRHTFATRSYEKEMSPSIVSKLMGHSNTKITQEVYTHISQEIVMREYMNCW